MKNIKQAISITLIAFPLLSCGTPEFQAEKSSCAATWISKIPPQYEQEMYNAFQTRQVPTGYTSCTGYGYSINCIQTMRTEYYTVPAVRTVDRNSSRRDAEINMCTQNACTMRYGNAECKVSN